jgi:hypothetical protein
VGLTKYLKAAFLHRWNLLAFLGGCGFAFLSGHPDVFVPLVLAGETAYLGFLGTHPKFQKYVDALEAKALRQDGSEAATAVARRMLFELPKDLEQRFKAVRSRCAELRQLARQMRDPDQAGGPQPLEDLQVSGLDRLLWMFLRLLFTEYSLNKFLERTSPRQIQLDFEMAEKRLKQVSEGDQSPHSQKIRRTLEDSLQTGKDRLANYEKAKANRELVQLEVDRLENKIKSLAEMSVNRQEPEFISDQVDQVAGSMLETEKTMAEIQFATGIAPLDEEAPELMQPPIQFVR